MRIHNFVRCSEVEGPGKRFAIWTQGCSIKCPGCFNEAAQDNKSGKEMRITEILAEIKIAMKTEGIIGVTIAGGEPFDQADELDTLVCCIKFFFEGLNVLVYTGYDIGVILSKEKQASLLEFIDVLIYGPFMQAQSPDSRRWIGSRNQGVRFNNKKLETELTPWPKEDFRSEIEICDSEIIICGNAVKLGE